MRRHLARPNRAGAPYPRRSETKRHTRQFADTHALERVLVGEQCRGTLQRRDRCAVRTDVEQRLPVWHEELRVAKGKSAVSHKKHLKIIKMANE